jgi:hypothetical protein
LSFSSPRNDFKLWKRRIIHSNLEKQVNKQLAASILRKKETDLILCSSVSNLHLKLYLGADKLPIFVSNKPIFRKYIIIVVNNCRANNTTITNSPSTPEK